MFLQPDHYLRPLLESIICSFWSLNPLRVHTPLLVLLFSSERCVLSSCWCADSSRTQQGTLPAVDKYAPICVFHLNVCLSWRSHSPEYPGLPLRWLAHRSVSGHSLQHAPPSSWAYNIKYTYWSTWAMTIICLRTGINSQTIRDKAGQLKAVDIFLLLISEVSTVVKSITKHCKTSCLEQSAPEAVSVGGTMQKGLWKRVLVQVPALTHTPFPLQPRAALFSHSEVAACLLILLCFWKLIV